MKLCSGTGLAISPIIASYIIPGWPAARPGVLIGQERGNDLTTWPRLASHWIIKMKQSNGTSRCAQAGRDSFVWMYRCLSHTPAESGEREEVERLLLLPP